jgi:hypothetical protein
MTSSIIDSHGNVEELSDAAFYERAFGHAPRTKAERLREWQADIERYADMIETGNEWGVPPPCLHDARLLVAGRKRARKEAA